jgi:crossover junction endodeoxyribonuclease RusA
MVDELELELPWPPSVNTYWRHPSSGPLAGRHLISGKGRLYRALVAGICHSTLMVQGPLSIEIMAHPPDRRVRDLDNILKSLLDSLVHANVIADDGQIDRLLIERQPVVGGGKVVLKIRRIDNEKNI